MLLIGKDLRCERERTGHSHMSQGDDDHAVGILGLNVAGNAAHVTEVGNS
jgi:hypothetical protein